MITKTPLIEPGMPDEATIWNFSSVGYASICLAMQHQDARYFHTWAIIYDATSRCVIHDRPRIILQEMSKTYERIADERGYVARQIPPLVLMMNSMRRRLTKIAIETGKTHHAVLNAHMQPRWLNTEWGKNPLTLKAESFVWELADAVDYPPYRVIETIARHRKFKDTYWHGE